MPPADPSQPALELRRELKEWERAFADAHGGRKPTREEVKKDARIAAKYTEYSRLRSPPSQPAPANTDPFAPSYSRPASSKSSRPRPRPPPPDIFKTPTKPCADMYESPLSTRGRRLFGNRAETVGPTPQKMGRVLGIFESFADSPTRHPHQHQHQHHAASSPQPSRVSASPCTTPRKRKAHDLSETPSKRPLPAAAAAAAAGGGGGGGGGHKDVLATPSFLRRSNSYSTFLDSPPVPRPFQPLVRGLSSMVAELRKLEDEAHGDDEEALRELEGGPPPPPPTTTTAAAATKVLENDPNTGLPPAPLGAWVDDVREEEPSAEAVPKWRKKGLKRQHRRVIMRPVGKTSHKDDPNATPPPPNPQEAELPSAGYDEEELSDLDAPPPPEEGGEGEGSEDPREVARAKRAKLVAEENAKSAAEKGKSGAKKAARKISDKAHANYKRLNIRGSKGAKAGSGGGRFSRKRR